MKMQLKRIVSAVCAVALCASVVTTPVLAIDGDDTSVAGTTQSESSASEGTQEETPVPAEPSVDNGEPEDTEPVEPENTQEDSATPPADPATGDGQQEDITNDVLEEPVSEEPASSVPSDYEAATPSVMSYNSPQTVHVNEELSITGKDRRNINGHVWSIEGSGTEYIKLVNNNESDVTITGLKATPSGEPVTLTHKYTKWMGFIPFNLSETFEITVLPAAPAEVYFYVAIPSNTTMSSEGSDYRFMMHGGTVKDPESNIVYQKDIPILSYEDESVFGESYIATWPTGGLEGKITLGNSNNAFGSDDVNDGSWLILDNSGSITDFSISFEVDDETVTYQPKDSDGHYALRWTKFSYASTDTANWQYHLDAMLYKVVTVEDAFEAITPEKTVDAFALGNDGQPTDSTFGFTLTCLDEGRSVNIPLTATIDSKSESKTANIVVTDEADANLELLPGTYQIAETESDANVWQNPSSDVIKFTVASDGTVALVQETGNNNQIANIQQTYTVTYDDGVDDGTVTDMPTDGTKYKYNESTTVKAAPKRAGFDFAGWSDGANTYEAGKSIKIASNVTLTAQWKEQDPGTVGPAGDVDIDKTATELVNNESDVTLSIGATNETVAADVVFVLDKSTSIDVKNAALSMLDELMQHMEEQNLTVKVGLVTFNKQADNAGFNMPLTALNAESKKELEEIFAKKLESGTNIEAGIRAGMAMLDADEEVPASNKHLVLVTDGVTYLWGAPTKTMYVEFNGGDSSVNIWNSNSTAASVVDKTFFNITQQAYVDSFANPAQWMNDNAQLETVIENYQTAPDNKATYVAIKDNTEYIANDAAVYMAGKAWKDAADKGYHLYSYASDKYNQDGQQLNTEGYYPWAYNFFSNLSTIGGYSVGFDEDNVNTEHMFDGVVNTILYAIDHGTVTDVIGEDFDLKAVDSFELTVGGVTLTQKTVEGNTVKFGTADSDGEYPYIVTYYPDGVEGDDREQFVWQINTPVESTAGLKLTYKVSLINVPTTIGEHKLPTNEEATLDYTSTNGGTGSEEFPKPEVTYNVVGVTPAVDDGGKEETNTPASTPSPTAAPAKDAQPVAAPVAAVIPQTGDDSQPLVWVALVIVSGAALTGLAVYRKKRSDK